jgi:hypothetical protein
MSMFHVSSQCQCQCQCHCHCHCHRASAGLHIVRLAGSQGIHPSIGSIIGESMRTPLFSSHHRHHHHHHHHHLAALSFLRPPPLPLPYRRGSGLCGSRSCCCSRHPDFSLSPPPLTSFYVYPNRNTKNTSRPFQEKEKKKEKNPDKADARHMMYRDRHSEIN